MKLGHLEIFAQNPLELQAFYRDILGFDLVTIQNEQFFWLKNGQLEILIRPGHKQTAANRYEDTNVGFVIYTDNVEQRLAHLQEKGVKMKGIVDSEKCYTFTDPAGNWFQLVNPNDH
ncbi:VOC family protein [Candidatus Leptofilum sp.]|uniref:VOC family protein n=1 Tax=Candidatus Leptofilum sp. TaxID=3241576 RepID=UPI003B599806